MIPDSGVITLNQQLIEKIHAGHGQFVLAVTGGGASVISDLFNVAGASRSILEAIVPYHEKALDRLVSSTGNSCNAGTARRMAMAAYQRALDYEATAPVFGIGCTSAIATDRERRGEDRCHAVLQSASETVQLDVVFSRSLGRARQEEICNGALLWLMQRALHIPTGTFSPGDADGSMTLSEISAPADWQSILAGDLRSTTVSSAPFVFPGSFNPIHDGHRAMIEYVKREKRKDVCLEISVINVDKPPIDYLTMQDRLDALPGMDVMFTNAPTFIEKSAIFPGRTFLVGTDTISRIAEPRYYESMDARDAALLGLAEKGNRFLVFGRQAGNDFMALSQLKLPRVLLEICEEVPEKEFRVDISSSLLRRNQSG